MGEVIKLKVATSEEVISLKSASGSLAVEAVSPRVSFEKIDGGTRLDITDVEGAKSTIIPDGEKGDPGESYTFDEYPTDNSPNPVRSRGLKSEFDSVRSDIQHYYDSAVEAVLNSEIRLNMKFGQKQDVLTFDEYPTANSDNPVKSNGIKILIDAIASTIPRHASDLIDDSGHYTKPPQGIPASDLAYGVIPDISGKQDLLLFDSTPTLGSHNPVSSNGIKRAIDTVYNQLSGETDLKLLAKANRVDECTEGNFAALDENGNLVDSGSKASNFLTQHQSISGKADKVTNATTGNFAGLDANGNLTDSGKKASDFLTQHQNITGKADKVANATNGNFAALNANGNLTDSGSKASDFVTGQALASALSGKQDVLTSADKYEIVEHALPPVAFPAVAVQTAGRIVNYTTGTVNVRASCDASVSVDISGYPMIRYSRVKLTGSNQSPGIAFYDKDHTFIEGSGVSSLMEQSTAGYVLHDVAVPTGAKYARFTMLADTETYGNFELYGIPGTFEILEQKADKTTVETISGTDPVITGVDNHRYVCGTVDTLTLTPPSSGIVDVVFTSGTTPTVLDVPSTVKWPDWFNPSALEASATYEINILNGTLGMVGIWT